MVDQPIAEAIKSSLAWRFCFRTSALFIVSPICVSLFVCIHNTTLSNKINSMYRTLCYKYITKCYSYYLLTRVRANTT